MLLFRAERFLTASVFAALMAGNALAQECHLVVASREHRFEAQRFCSELSIPCDVYMAKNAWYAVSVGEFESPAAARPVIERLVSKRLIPDDAFCTPGTHFIHVFSSGGMKRGSTAPAISSPVDRYNQILRTTVPRSPEQTAAIWRLVADNPNFQAGLAHLWSDYSYDYKLVQPMRREFGYTRTLHQVLTDWTLPHLNAWLNGKGNIHPWLAYEVASDIENRGIRTREGIRRMRLMYQHAAQNGGDTELRRYAAAGLDRLASPRPRSSTPSLRRSHCDPNDPNTVLRLDCM